NPLPDPGGPCNNALADQWSWDGSAWAPVTPVDYGDGVPPAASGHVMTYDYNRHIVVMTGGNSDTTSCGCLECRGLPPWQGMWEWDGAGWRSIASSGQGSMPATAGVLMAVDPTSGVVTMTGDCTSSPCQTYRWQDGAWRLVNGATTIPARVGTQVS